MQDLGSCCVFPCLPPFLSMHDETPSTLCKKEPFSVAWKTLLLPPKVWNIEVFCQCKRKTNKQTNQTKKNNNKNKNLNPRLLKLKSRDGGHKPVKKWFSDFCTCRNQINIVMLHTAMNSLTPTGFVSTFSYYCHICILPMNMDILNIFLFVNK